VASRSRTVTAPMPPRLPVRAYRNASSRATVVVRCSHDASSTALRGPHADPFDLQRRVGNAAVSAIVGGAVVQRDETGGPAAADAIAASGKKIGRARLVGHGQTVIGGSA
jgi:hypothetical protein